jgi:integrase-like protein
VGRITRYGALLELVWQPLLAATTLPYRKPHAMRHSYATWMLEAGADLRWVKDQLGHASIDETEGTYGHLEREQHERRVDLDAVLGTGSGASTGVHASDAGAAIEGQRRDFPREDFLVEGKGFVLLLPISSRMLKAHDVKNRADRGIPRNPAQHGSPSHSPGDRSCLR